MFDLTVNGKRYEVDVDAEMPLAWVLRDRIDLKGTRVSCAAGLCGACTVIMDGRAVRSCILPVQQASGKSITTIEGLGEEGLHPVQQAWIAEDVVQCGYCQSGFIMAAAAFIADHESPTDDEIDNNITNICRCGTFARARKAIHRAAEIAGTSSGAGERA